MADIGICARREILLKLYFGLPKNIEGVSLNDNCNDEEGDWSQGRRGVVADFWKCQCGEFFLESHSRGNFVESPCRGNRGRGRGVDQEDVNGGDDEK